MKIEKYNFYVNHNPGLFFNLILIDNLISPLSFKTPIFSQNMIHTHVATMENNDNIIIYISPQSSVKKKKTILSLSLQQKEHCDVTTDSPTFLLLCYPSNFNSANIVPFVDITMQPTFVKNKFQVYHNFFQLK